MKSELENFINNHKNEFETQQVSDELWQKISKKLPKSKKTNIFKIGVKWAVAASLMILTFLFIYFLLNKKTNINEPNIVKVVPNKFVVDTQKLEKEMVKKEPDSINTKYDYIENDKSEKDTYSKAEQDLSNETEKENNVTSEIYHYSKLIQIKQKQIYTLKKDEPLLYKQFLNDIEEVEKSYKVLKNQVKNKFNQEQIIEAMIENLQLQSNILNKQLDVIKKINNHKKTVYENSFKSI